MLISSTTQRSLDSTYAQNIALIREVQASFQYVSFASLQPGTSSGHEFVSNKMKTTAESIDGMKLNTPSVTELVAHPSLSNNVSELVSVGKKWNQATAARLFNLSEDFATVTKYLQYSPKDDFAFYGQSPEEDQARIQSAIEGIRDTAEKSGLNEDVKKQLIVGLKAMQDFKTDGNLENLQAAITDSQQQIIQAFSKDYLSIADEYISNTDQLFYQ